MNAPDLSPDGEMDLRVLIARLFAKRWWIFASIVVFTILFYVLAHVLTPIYRASILLIPAKAEHGMDSSSGGGIGGVASLVGINLGGGDSDREEALAVLKSRQFTEKFIDDLKLMPVLYAKAWDPQTGTWKGDEKHRPTPSRAYRYFDKLRAVVLDKKTGLITMNIDWTDRIAAAEWANQLVDRLNLEMRKRAMVRADAAVGYLEKEFETTNAVATREAIGHLIEAQVKNRMLAAVTVEFSFRIIDKAMPPDKDDVHFPNKFLMLLAGPVVGFVIGVFCVLAYAAFKDMSLDRKAAP